MLFLDLFNCVAAAV